MILYHGTNYEFDKIGLNMCRPGTDFGKGFYLTPVEDRALERAIAKVKAFGGTPIVTQWEFDEMKARELNMLNFERESLEWAEFGFKNRTLDEYEDNFYDIISGPVADDNLRMQFNLVKRGFLSLEELASKLTFDKQNFQLCFRTTESTNLLKRI